MSLRHALPLVALALTFAVGLLPLGAPEAEQPEPFVPLAERVTARAPALPQYAASPQARIEQQLASANAMWKTAFDEAGDSYEAPALVTSSPDCGVDGGWAGIYCSDGHRIAIDIDGHVRRHGAAGQALADTVLGYVVAHEVAHHVQTLRGAPDLTPHRELHADCLAGVWGKAAGIPLPPMWAYGEDAEHGTAAQRVHWLNEGYRSARPADCDAIWSTSTTP